MDDIIENVVTACLIKVRTFLELICRNIQLESRWMDNIAKKEIKYEWSAVYEHKNNPWVRYLYAADVHYHLDCWLGVTVKNMPAGWVQL